MCTVCFVDDDKNKAGKYLKRRTHCRKRERYPKACGKNMPLMKFISPCPPHPQKDKKEIIEICRECPCGLKNPSGDLPAVKRGSQRGQAEEGGNRRPSGTGSR